MQTAADSLKEVKGLVETGNKRNFRYTCMEYNSLPLPRTTQTAVFRRCIYMTTRKF